MNTTQTVSTERLNEMLAGLEGVTPGPWVHETGDDEEDGSPLHYVSSQFSTVDDLTVVALMGVESTGASVDAAHIARCDPDTMRSILTELLNTRLDAHHEVHRCFICDEPFKAGQLVLSDVNEGLGHRACFGEDRESYVKDLDTGEPLGPDDPIPAGEPYDPADYPEFARNAEPVAIPVGWHLVPEVPTEAQMEAGLYQSSHDAEYADVCQSYMDMVRTPVDAPTLYAAPMPAVPDGLKQALIARAREDGPLFIEDIEDAVATFTPPSPQAETAPTATCERCQGNGEIVTDWDRYLHAHPGDKGDEAAAECPDCNGTGRGETAPDVVGRDKEWAENVEAMLSTGDPDVIRCHEGGGPEDLIMSLVLTMSRTRNSRDAALRQHAQVDEAMVERFLQAYVGPKRLEISAFQGIDERGPVRAALTAAVGGGE